jgi:hypothetical protein
MAGQATPCRHGQECLVKGLRTRGVFIAPELIQRLRMLKMRTRVGFHPHTGTRADTDY